MVEMKVKEDEKSNKTMDELEVMKDDWRWLTIKFKSEKDNEWIYRMMRSGFFKTFVMCIIQNVKKKSDSRMKNQRLPKNLRKGHW
jgi:Zn-finger domain-containing protein